MRSHLSLLPTRGIGVVAMSNGGVGSALTDLVAAFVYDVDAGRPDAYRRAQQRLDSLRALWPEFRRTEHERDSLAAIQERTPPAEPVSMLLGHYSSKTHGTLHIVERGPSLAIAWGVLTAPLRAVDPANGTYRFTSGGTEFALRFEWSDTPGTAPATAVVVNDIRLPRDTR